MTSIADRTPGGALWLRLVSLLLLLGLLGFSAPAPWGWLWIAVPVSVAASLLAAWRFGRWSVLIPVALLGAGLGIGGPQSLWIWWAPAAALAGVWMGLREETSPAVGERAWSLWPVLLLAALLPWATHYREAVRTIDSAMPPPDATSVRWLERFGYSGASLQTMQAMLNESDAMLRKALPSLLPTALFLWLALLVGAGRALSSRFSALLRWPPLTRGRLSEWRLPDGALWVFLAGLGLVLAEWKDGSATAWTLLLNSSLGFCVQGIAVVESLALARGVPAAILYPTMLFLFLATLPYFVLCAGALGLSDVWLDYRRLERSADDPRDGANR